MFVIKYHIIMVTFYIINTAIVVKTREPKDKQLCDTVHNNIRHTHYLSLRLNHKVNLKTPLPYITSFFTVLQGLNCPNVIIMLTALLCV